jgi:toxin ParE1/3/4
MAHRVAPEAEAELDSIWYYSLRKAAASRLPIGSLIPSLRVSIFSRHPHIGRHRDEDLRAGLRSFPVGEYVIVYRVEEHDVLILHVFRGSRNIEALLRE